MSVRFRSRYAIRLSVTECDPAARQVVWRELDLHLVAGGDADVVHAHLSRDMGKHLVPVFEFDTEHGIGQRFNNRAFDQNCVVLGLGQGAHHLGDFGLRWDITSRK